MEPPRKRVKESMRFSLHLPGREMGKTVNIDNLGDAFIANHKLNYVIQTILAD